VRGARGRVGGGRGRAGRGAARARLGAVASRAPRPRSGARRRERAGGARRPACCAALAPGPPPGGRSLFLAAMATGGGGGGTAGGGARGGRGRRAAAGRGCGGVRRAWCGRRASGGSRLLNDEGARAGIQGVLRAEVGSVSPGLIRGPRACGRPDQAPRSHQRADRGSGGPPVCVAAAPLHRRRRARAGAARPRPRPGPPAQGWRWPNHWQHISKSMMLKRHDRKKRLGFCCSPRAPDASNATYKPGGVVQPRRGAGAGWGRAGRAALNRPLRSSGRCAVRAVGAASLLGGGQGASSLTAPLEGQAS
jgi:hypothetical protein